MSDRNKIIAFCKDYLKVDKFEDYCTNGLQVEGKKEINKIVTGVTFSEKLIKEAIKKKADMIIVHHGLFGDQIGKQPVIKGFIAGRLKLLLSKDINLAGYHLPLDAHPLIGNNAGLCRLLGIRNLKPFDVGFIGVLSRPMEFRQFVSLVDKKLQTKSYAISAGKKFIKSVGVISGGSSPDFKKAAELGADTYIAGDIRESVVEAINEIGINFINAGHYNTEKLGIQNLGNLIAKKFKVKVEFIDIPCEI